LKSRTGQHWYIYLPHRNKKPVLDPNTQNRRVWKLRNKPNTSIIWDVQKLIPAQHWSKVQTWFHTIKRSQCCPNRPIYKPLDLIILQDLRFGKKSFASHCSNEFVLGVYPPPHCFMHFSFVACFTYLLAWLWVPNWHNWSCCWGVAWKSHILDS
jgi:hypothetical protein